MFMNVESQEEQLYYYSKSIHGMSNNIVVTIIMITIILTIFIFYF